MNISEDNVRIIFGLKLRQVRSERAMSLTALSKASGLSVSYLNEIEKGKKYPKSGKILAISKALSVNYDELVSLKLSKKLAPIGKLLQSSFFDEFPLELFGLELNKLIDIVAKAPIKINALIGTLTDLSRNFNVSTDDFYKSSLRAYQEMNGNYFEEIESAVQTFLAEQQLQASTAPKLQDLADILCKQYEFSIDYNSLKQHPELKQFRFLISGKDNNKLYINPALDDSQKAFVIARQIGFNHLGLKELSLSSPWLRVDSFEQVLSNFKASYFAGALIINRDSLVHDIGTFLSLPSWDSQHLIQMMNKYSSSPDMFMQRITNILPKFFNIKNLFFIRMRQPQNNDYYKMTKELHFSQMHAPHGNEQQEHYCRRWIAIRILQDIELQRQSGTYRQQQASIQRSRFIGSDNEYLVISMGRTMVSQPEMNYSVAIGFILNKELKKRIKFCQDPKIPSDIVNTTCEGCHIDNCNERAAPAIHIQKQQQHKKITDAINDLRHSHEPY